MTTAESISKEKGDLRFKASELGDATEISLLRFLYALPAHWIALKTLEAALLRSKTPEWFGCYSTKKLLLIIVCSGLALTWIWLSRLSPIPHRLIEVLRLMVRRYKIVYFVTAILSFLIFLKLDIRIGEDVSGQVQSTLQWEEGLTRAPNFRTAPQWEDLSESKSGWSIRPPGAALLAAPGLWLGFSLGYALRSTLFFFALLGGFGWLILIEHLHVRKTFLPFLGISFGITTGVASTSFSTTNIVLFGLTPWAILWAMRMGKLWTKKKVSPSFRQLLEATSFYLLLGSFAWIKLSGMIVAITIASIPCLLILKCQRDLKERAKSFCALVSTSIVLFGPYVALEKVNARLAGVSADDTYRRINYNEQALLWGDHFTESTQGYLLAWSVLGGPGYALPAKQIAHGTRDFLEQFPAIRQWQANYELNGHALFAGGVGVILSLVLVLTLLRLKNRVSSEAFLLCALFISLPFLGLAAVSHLHGFNYVLYHSHTAEYASLLCVPAILAFSCPDLSKKTSTTLLMFVCFAVPITIHAEKIARLPFEEASPAPSHTERNRGFGAHDFSKAITIIENDSSHQSDILLFLPSGDMGDLLLRTRLRSTGIHFARDNLKRLGPAWSSKPQVIYCAYPATLKDDPLFQKALEEAFPQKVSSSELSTSTKKKIIVLKVFLHDKVI